MIKKISISIIAISFGIIVNAQSSLHTKLVEIGRTYKTYQGVDQPPKNYRESLLLNLPGELTATEAFYNQVLIPKNKLLTEEYLKIPDENTLKYIYVVQAINYNLRDENQINNDVLIDSLWNAKVSKEELIETYYGILFGAIINGDKFDFTKVDFTPSKYNLANETEQGIFFLVSMNYLGKLIWGYMNIAQPMNTKKTWEYIKKYPKYNGLKYYQYTDLNFPDFEIQLEKNKPKESFKSYYIHKFYEILISHLICLNKENGKESDINNLLMGSILKDNSLYKYTSYKETLESIFKVQE